jgi:hypothetical protein
MPDFTKTDIGRRMYLLHKEKNVERIIEMMRHNLGAEWKSLSEADIHLLERLLGDAWVTSDKIFWENIPFGRISRHDVEQLLAIGKFKDLDKTPKTQVLDEVQKVLLAVR